MTSMKSLFPCSLVFTIVAIGCIEAAEPPPEVLFSIRTEKSVYIPGEPVMALITLENRGNTPIEEPESFALRVVCEDKGIDVEYSAMPPGFGRVSMFLAKFRQGKSVMIPCLLPGETKTQRNSLNPLRRSAVVAAPPPGHYTIRCRTVTRLIPNPKVGNMEELAALYQAARAIPLEANGEFDISSDNIAWEERVEGVSFQITSEAPPQTAQSPFCLPTSRIHATLYRV